MNVPNNKQCSDIMNCIQQAIEYHNPYLAAYRHMAEVERDELLQAEREGRVPSVVKMYL